jgi:hypothetical protein
MKEIVILATDPDRTVALQTLIGNIFPECKTRILSQGEEVIVMKKGERHGKHIKERS